MLYEIISYVVDALRFLERNKVLVVAFWGEEAAIVSWHNVNNENYKNNGKNKNVEQPPSGFRTMFRRTS